MFSVLHGRCHPSHMHSHQMPENQAGQNINVRAAMIHVIGDLVQSIGVFLSSLIIKFYVSFFGYLLYQNCIVQSSSRSFGRQLNIILEDKLNTF